MNRDGDAHHDLPEEVRPLARRLAAAGLADRTAGAEVADRVVMRTAHLLREQAAALPAQRGLRRLLPWLVAPATVAACALLVVAVLRPGLTAEPEPRGVEVLAANLEHDLETWLELDAEWRRDSFENSLAALALDAASVAARADDPSALPALENGS